MRNWKAGVWQRDENLRAFKQDNATRVILISLKAGGEGLNLQHADHIFVVDPWWNPAAELQVTNTPEADTLPRPTVTPCSLLLPSTLIAAASAPVLEN